MKLYDQRPSGTLARARDLRRNASEPERRLLRGLREAFPHLKWRRQVPLGPFFADILCFSERLVIEVDGDTHAARNRADALRAAMMARAGYSTIRIANADVMQNLAGVLTQISFSLGEKEGALALHGKDEGATLTKRGGAA